MKRSTERILTTHVGSLPAAPELDPKAEDYEARCFCATGERKDRLEGPGSASGPYALIWRPLNPEI